MNEPVPTTLRSPAALAAVAGPVLFTGAWLVLGAVSEGYTMFDLRIEPYSVVSQPISGLGLGSTGPWMNAAFVVSGISLAVGLLAAIRVLPLRPRLARLTTALLLLTPVGLAVCGVFDLEHILLHLVGFLLATGTPVLSFVLLGLQLRRRAGWERLSRLLLVASPATAALLAGFFVAFDPMAAGDNTGVAGLVQRALAVVVLSSLGALGWVAARRPRSLRAVRPRTPAGSAA